MKFIRENGKQWGIVIGGVALILLVQSWYLARPDTLVGQAAPAFDVELLDGDTRAFAGGPGGGIMVLDFWAVWCPPCREGLPGLARISESYATRGVQVYAINQGDAPERIRGFLEDAGVSLPVGLDPEGKTGAAYGVRAIPKTVIIDGAGVVIKTYVGSGPGSEREIRDVLDGLLREAAKAGGP